MDLRVGKKKVIKEKILEKNQTHLKKIYIVKILRENRDVRYHHGERKLWQVRNKYENTVHKICLRDMK